MALLNWPPSKGPLPPHLRIVKSEVRTDVKRQDFKFQQPDYASAERRQLLEAVMEHHDNKQVIEKVGTEYPLGRKKSESEFHLDYPLSVLAKLTSSEADALIRGAGVRTGMLYGDLPARTYVVPLEYPLTVGCFLRLHPFRVIKHMGDGRKITEESQSIGVILWIVANEYRRIYADWKHYKPWGHGIEDLTFRTMAIRRTSPYHTIDLGFES